jgi:hypothetical protein
MIKYGFLERPPAFFGLGFRPQIELIESCISKTPVAPMNKNTDYGCQCAFTTNGRMFD